MIQICIILASSFVDQTGPEQRSHIENLTGQLVIALCVFFVRPNSLKFIKMLGFGLLELLPDIPDMQSGAKCHSESISGIHFASKCVRKAPGTGTGILNDVTSAPGSRTRFIKGYIYIYIYFFAYCLSTHLAASERTGLGGT